MTKFFESILSVGTKDWKIYRPLNGFVLPNGPSEDLSQEVIGEPVLEVTLNVGDVLYLPKGTVHQAMAQNEHCVHLTVSTYQRWTWADLTEALTKESILVIENTSTMNGFVSRLLLNRSVFLNR